MSKLVLLRHGQSTWNLENRFTGWVDVDLTEQGREEAKRAGETLKAEGIQFDCVYTSVLKRAIRTMWITLDGLDQMWLPVTRDWRLNERSYGGLSGLNKAETAAKHGEDQVLVWRRSFDIPPPEMDTDSEFHPSKDRRYEGIDAPTTESLATTLDRVLPYFDAEIVPQLKAGKNVLIVAHGNSLRALVMHLKNISSEEITGLNIPTAQPWAFDLDADMNVLSDGYLADEETVKAAAEAVANQGKA